MTINSMINTIPNLQYATGGINSQSNDNQYDQNVEQLDKISSILSNYDPNNLSAEDATQIATAFQENGIEPSKELADTMSTFGFDAQEVGKLAGVQGNRPNTPPPPPPSQEEQEEVTDILSELLSKDEESQSSNAFEQILDYTSHIVNLNDNSREKVNELFEQYKPDNTKLSQEDASTVVKNSLSQILGDSSNYNSVSFYA